MPQTSRLYALIRVLTAPIVNSTQLQVNPIVNCPSYCHPAILEELIVILVLHSLSQCCAFFFVIT